MRRFSRIASLFPVLVDISCLLFCSSIILGFIFMVTPKFMSATPNHFFLLALCLSLQSPTLLTLNGFLHFLKKWSWWNKRPCRPVFCGWPMQSAPPPPSSPLSSTLKLWGFHNIYLECVKNFFVTFASFLPS